MVKEKKKRIETPSEGHYSKKGRSYHYSKETILLVAEEKSFYVNQTNDFIDVYINIHRLQQFEFF